jgi:hypothetical protein
MKFQRGDLIKQSITIRNPNRGVGIILDTVVRESVSFCVWTNGNKTWINNKRLILLAKAKQND